MLVRIGLMLVMCFSYAEPVALSLEENYPAHAYHESSQETHDLVKTEKVDDQTHQEDYTLQQALLEKVALYALSLDYVNFKQHFELIRPFFDDEGWNAYNDLLKIIVAEVKTKKQISRLTLRSHLTWSKHASEAGVIFHNAKLPVRIYFYPEVQSEDYDLDVSLRCFNKEHCLVHSISINNEKVF